MCGGARTQLLHSTTCGSCVEGIKYGSATAVSSTGEGTRCPHACCTTQPTHLYPTALPLCGVRCRHPIAMVERKLGRPSHDPLILILLLAPTPPFTKQPVASHMRTAG